MSTVIKAGEAGPVLRRLSTVDLADHLSEARAVVAAARREASGILAGARARAEQVRAGARQSGHEAGYRQGYEEGAKAGRQAAYEEALKRFKQQQSHLVADMNDAIAAIERIKEDLRIAAENDLLRFAVDLASRLTFAIGRLHREAAAENLKRALRLVESQTDLTVRVHPDDVASMETFASSVLKQAEAARTISIQADDSLAPGGCVVESARTRVDATLEKQMAEIVALLTGETTSDA